MGDKKIHKLEQQIEQLRERVNDIEGLLEGNHAIASNGMRAFVLDQDLGTHTERATAIGYFLEFEEDQDNFTSHDLEEGYRTCRLQKPSNPSDILAKAENRGWLMRDSESERTQLWRLTNDGIDFVKGGRGDGN